MDITQFIDPALLALVPVLAFLGKIIKDSTKIDNTLIPLLLGIAGVLLASVWVLATREIHGFQEGLMAFFVAFVQGLLCAGAAVYGNQLFRQARIRSARRESEGRKGEKRP